MPGKLYGIQLHEGGTLKIVAPPAFSMLSFIVTYTSILLLYFQTELTGGGHENLLCIKIKIYESPFTFSNRVDRKPAKNSLKIKFENIDTEFLQK